MKDYLFLLLKLIGAWFVLTLILAVLFEPVWKVPVAMTFLTAAFFALRLVWDLYDPKYDTTWETVLTLRSPDDVVVGTIEQISKGKVGAGYSYISCVRRNYVDRVYQKKKEFDSLHEAELWLEAMYAQAMHRHFSNQQCKNRENWYYPIDKRP